MNISTDSLTVFLLARIAEDEAVAQACSPGWTGPESMGAIEGGGSVLVSPKRVLAECEAKRAIVEEHSPWATANGYCGAHDGRYLLEDCPTLRALALSYADHPQFQDDWRP